MNEEQKPTTPPPAQDTSSQRREIAPFFYSKRAWSILGVLLFLLGIGTLVPVGQIPLLRNLAYAMGYSPDELSHLSFLKALFSWSDHDRALHGDEDPNARLVFGEDGGFFNSRSEKASNQLFSIRSVNAYRRKQGQAREDVTGAYTTAEGAEVQADAVRVKNPAAATTEANRESTGDVFFGTDRNAVQRDKNDGYQSVNALKKINNPNVAGGGHAEDWFARAVDRAVETSADLQNLEKNLNRSGNSSLANLSGIGKVGQSRAKRDMYYAWMTGRAARRTPQVILKKTLAAAGFNGAELPRTVFTAGGPSGVGINPDEIEADLDTVQRYLKLDEQCQEALQNTAGEGMPKWRDIVALINSLDFPDTCADTTGSHFLGTLDEISRRCGVMQGVYQTAQNNCSALEIVVNDEQHPNQCQSPKLYGMYRAFVAQCRWEREQCNSLSGDELAQCIEEALAYSSSNTFHENPPDGVISYTSGQVAAEIPATFYDNVHGTDTPRLEYFPGIDWQRSLWVDENAGD